MDVITDIILAFCLLGLALCFWVAAVLSVYYMFTTISEDIKQRNEDRKWKDEICDD